MKGAPKFPVGLKKIDKMTSVSPAFCQSKENIQNIEFTWLLF